MNSSPCEAVVTFGGFGRLIFRCRDSQIPMKLLPIITAGFEALTGIGLLLAPSMTISLLLGAELDMPIALVPGRIAGAALIALAIACWQARNGERHGAAAGVVAGMFFYNVATVLVVTYAGVGLGLQSPMMWPVVVAHTALAVWCAMVLWLQRKRIDGGLN